MKCPAKSEVKWKVTNIHEHGIFFSPKSIRPFRKTCGVFMALDDEEVKSNPKPTCR